MSSRDRYGKFRKKDFIWWAKWTIGYLCFQFGYKKKPFLIETKLPSDLMMEFYNDENFYAIIYDYKSFKAEFKDKTRKELIVYTVNNIAHEMRHYYQYRQMKSRRPREPKKIIERWLENKNNPKNPSLGHSVEEYAHQPLELDAELFAYLFCADEFGKLILRFFKDLEHYEAVEKLYIEYYGEADKDLFPLEAKECFKKE